MFFGDRNALREAQITEFKRLKGPDEWNRLRTEIHENETSLGKAFDRFGISRKEQKRLMAAAALRVPPPYNEMKKLLGIK